MKNEIVLDTLAAEIRTEHDAERDRAQVHAALMAHLDAKLEEPKAS